MPDRSVREAALVAMAHIGEVGDQLDALASSAEVREALSKPGALVVDCMWGSSCSDEDDRVHPECAVAAVLDALGGTADTEDARHD